MVNIKSWRPHSAIYSLKALCFQNANIPWIKKHLDVKTGSCWLWLWLGTGGWGWVGHTGFVDLSAFLLCSLLNMEIDIHYRQELFTRLFSEYSSHDIMRNGRIHRSRWNQQDPLIHLTTEAMEAHIVRWLYFIVEIMQGLSEIDILNLTLHTDSVGLCRSFVIVPSFIHTLHNPQFLNLLYLFIYLEIHQPRWL